MLGSPITTPMLVCKHITSSQLYKYISNSSRTSSNQLRHAAIVYFLILSCCSWSMFRFFHLHFLDLELCTVTVNTELHTKTMLRRCDF